MRKAILLLLLLVGASIACLPSDTLDVYFINVGHGDAILIDCGDWEALLDAGRGYSAPNEAVLAVLAEHVVDGILELAILSHPHADHYGGFQAVFSQYEVWEFWRSFDTEPDTSGPTYSCFLNALAAEGLIPRLLERGDRFVTGQIEWAVLGPGELRTGRENDDENSLVFLLTYGDVRFLFVGDIEVCGEIALLDIDLPAGTLILKVAHHGLNRSTSLAFLDWAKPDLAIISTKEAFPHATINLASVGIPYYTTKDEETICMATDGSQPPVVRTDGAPLVTVADGIRGPNGDLFLEINAVDPTGQGSTAALTATTLPGAAGKLVLKRLLGTTGSWSRHLWMAESKPR